jgi:hypothetical protein
MTETIIKGVALIRVSTAAQATESKASIPAQREAIGRLIQQHQIEIVRTFEFIDLSGAWIRFSSEYREFLQTIERPTLRR